MKRCALFILLLTAVAGTMSCFIGGSAPEGPAALIPDGAHSVVLADVSQAALNRTDLPPSLERRASNLDDYGDVRQQAAVSLASGEVTITRGDFAFDDIREALGEDGYDETEYRGYSFWESSGGSRVTALLDDDGFLIDGGPDAVAEVLRNRKRDSGLLWNDDEGELNRAMDLAGEGLVTLASRHCGLDDNRGCSAVAWAFSRDEERRTVIEGAAAILFRSVPEANSAMPIIEQAIDAHPIMTLTEIGMTGATVILKTDIDRDQFSSLELPVSLRRQ